MDKKLTITEWAEEDRPREKLMRLGAEALSNAELLAILIGSGSTKESAVELMKRIMADCSNNLNSLGKLSINNLITYKGIGLAKAITIIAACELGKRRQASTIEDRPELNSALAIYDYMHTKLQDLDIEEAWVLLLNPRYRLISEKRISHGGLTATTVDIRLIMKEAILKNATVIVLIHNHPSNNPHPSREDDKLTKRLNDACNFMNIFLLDHVIIVDGTYYSYREEGRI